MAKKKTLASKVAKYNRHVSRQEKAVEEGTTSKRGNYTKFGSATQKQGKAKGKTIRKAKNFFNEGK